jgi:hypothetical protein
MKTALYAFLALAVISAIGCDKDKPKAKAKPVTVVHKHFHYHESKPYYHNRPAKTKYATKVYGASN